MKKINNNEPIAESSSIFWEKISKEGEFLKSPKIGDIIKGRVVGVSRSSIFIDMGIVGTGIVYGREFQKAKDILKNLNTGDEITTKVVDLENKEGYIELSASQAEQELVWDTLKRIKSADETIKVKILGANKGGLLAKVSGIPAFLPVSQLSPENYPRVEEADKSKILKELQKFIAQELEVKILTIDQNEEKLILSEKAKEAGKIQEKLENYKVGNVVEGKVTGIVDFGIFIKFGEENLEGLCHISELDWQLIDNPDQIVKIGETVQAKIIEISNSKVFLSLKALKKDPWENIEEKYKKGDVVKGSVIKFNPFGVFVQIDKQKIHGLAHISEFSDEKKMDKKLEINKSYDFEILSIEPAQHKMALKLVEPEKNK
ncbi:MAG: S1 RNA-binding domain-containing protein [bacterium]